MALLDTLRDTFDDAVIDPVKWPDSYDPGGYTQTGGRARVTCATNYNGYASASAYTLEKSQARCQLFPPADGGATAEAWAQLLITSATPGTDAIIEVNAATGILGMQVRVGYFDAVAAALPYDPVAHAWVRIRETGGNLLWQTSADGLTWTTRRTAASPAWVADADLQVQLLAHRDGGTDDFAEFDNFNVNPATPFASLADDFSSPAVDTAKWPDNYNEAPGGAMPDQPAGRARVPCDTDFAAYASAAIYTLASSRAAVQIVPPAVGGATGSVFCQLLIISDVAGTQIVFEIDVSTNLLLMAVHVDFNDENPGTLPYDPAQHAWLRISETGGLLRWETSPDGRAWTTQHTETAPSWVADTNLQTQLLAYRDDGTPDYAYFDNFNITPTLTDGYTVAIDWAGDGSYDGTYDDVTTDVLARGPVVFQYGRDQDRQLAPPAVGSLTMTLCNADRIYSPENPDSPIADDLSPAAPVKVETVVDDVLYPLFMARVDDFEVHPDRGDRSADITALSLLSLLQGVKISSELYQAERTGTLIGVVLDTVGWTGPRDLDLGATFVPWWWLEETDALSAVTDLLASEGPPSIAYVGPDGTFIFRDRHHRLLRPASIVSQAAFASRHIGACDPCNDPVERYGAGCYGFGEYGG